MNGLWALPADPVTCAHQGHDWRVQACGIDAGQPQIALTCIQCGDHQLRHVSAEEWMLTFNLVTHYGFGLAWAFVQTEWVRQQLPRLGSDEGTP